MAAIVSIDALRQRRAFGPPPGPQWGVRSDVQILEAELADAWERDRQLVGLCQLLLEELRALAGERDRWAHEWSALQQLLAAEFDFDERYCCYCGSLFRGAAKACPEHVYLLVHEASRQTDPYEQLLADIYPSPPVSPHAGAD